VAASVASTIVDHEIDMSAPAIILPRVTFAIAGSFIVSDQLPFKRVQGVGNFTQR
jgi:hypothetical protein